jgi:Transposase DDE domain group 1
VLAADRVAVVERTELAPGDQADAVMVAVYCGSYDKPPASVTLDIDDTLDVVDSHQQLSMFNAHYDERCFLPIHVYDTATSRRRPFRWTKDPNKIIAAVKRGHQVLDSIH